MSAATGRHRAASYHPLAELRTVLGRASESGLKASAVLAASGGMIAAFAVPANAAASRVATSPAAAVPAAPVPAAPVAPASSSLLAAAALIAPVASGVELHEAFGISGVKVIAKPKPKPKPVVLAATVGTPSRGSGAATRSATRTSRVAVVNTKPQSSSAIVNIARTLLGIYYVWGGSTPAGFDCSGFTSYVYRQAGISIPRVASAQQAAATRVTNPQPGDLVFFGYPAYHVGIYTGPGMMIDSPRTGKPTQERAIYSSSVSYGRF